MARRNPNGYGGITRLKGKRNKPFMAYVSEIRSEGVIIPPDKQKALKCAKQGLQDAETVEEVMDSYKKGMELLHSVAELKEKLLADLEKDIKKNTFKSKQVKKPIGYFKTQAEANIALAEYNKNPYDIDKRNTTFKEVFDMAYKDARIENKSLSAQRSYRSAFNKCESIWNIPVSELKLVHLQSIIDENSSMSKSSQNNIIIVQHMVFNYACKHDLAEKDYSAFVKMTEHREEKEKKPYTREEIELLWQNVDWTFEGQKKSTLSGLKVTDIILILIYTGMRIDELLSLKSEDVHLEERYITVNGTKTSNAYRLIPIHKKIQPLLEARLNVGSIYLISDTEGRKVHYKHFNTPVYKSFCKALGLDHSIHETRHTFATYTTKMDSTLRSYIIGHSTKNLTNDVYTHPEVLLPELLEEINRLDL